jgi:hypothetical protein
MSKAKLRAYNLWDGMSMKRSGMMGVTGGECVGEGVDGPAWPEDMVGTSHGWQALKASQHAFRSHDR